MTNKDLTFGETLYVLRKVNEAWSKYIVDHHDNTENPYNMITEQVFNNEDGWEEIGMFTLPFVEAPRSAEVANHECIHYYKENNKEYLWIGDYRYTLNDAVKKLFI